MKQRESYIRNTGQFLAKLKAAGEVPKAVILVTADVVGLCHSILPAECLDKFCNSILRFINKYQERLLERSLSLCVLVSLLTTLKRNLTHDIKHGFWKIIFIGGIFYEQKVKRAYKNSLKTSINFTLILSLLRKNLRRKLIF